MPEFTRAFAAPLVAAGLLIAVAGCSSGTSTPAAASGTQLSSATSATASGTANVTSSPTTPPSPAAPGSPSAAASTSNSNTPPSPPAAVPSQSVGENRPFPGIWDITSWAQYTAAQKSVEQGHQPWLLDPASVVRAWASQWNPVPEVRQIATDTFQVTKPGTNTVYTIRGTRPVPRGAAAIWVITSITHS